MMGNSVPGATSLIFFSVTALLAALEGGATAVNSREVHSPGRLMGDEPRHIKKLERDTLNVTCDDGEELVFSSVWWWAASHSSCHMVHRVTGELIEKCDKKGCSIGVGFGADPCKFHRKTLEGYYYCSKHYHQVVKRDRELATISCPKTGTFIDFHSVIYGLEDQFINVTHNARNFCRIQGPRECVFNDVAIRVGDIWYGRNKYLEVTWRCLDPCAGNPCRHGGCKSFALGKYKCHCEAGTQLVGDWNQINGYCKKQACQGNPCGKDRGSCVPQPNGTFTCVCNAGFVNKFNHCWPLRRRSFLQRFRSADLKSSKEATSLKA